jgi:hypothetical protein
MIAAPEARAGLLRVRGLLLSHLGVLENAEQKGHERILIFEDDLDFSSDFAARWPAVLARLKDEPWSVFYGGHVVGDDAPVLGTGPLTRYPAHASVQTAHFLGLQGRAIGILVSHLKDMLARPPGDPRGGPMHVDGAYCWFRKAHPEFETWLANPPLGHQRSSKTDIHELRWYDRTLLVRECVAVARRIRNRMSG